MSAALVGTSLPLPLLRRGKVRDVYEVDVDRLLLVATDRISAFDVVMQEAIPYKGAVLTQLSAWWFGQLGADVAHHLLTADTDEILHEIPVLTAYRDVVAGRAMLCVRADVVPIECVIRGYLAGSAWKEYKVSGTLAGEPLALHLRESDRLEPAVFSPATKAETGHDENIPIASVAHAVGASSALELERLSRYVYEFGRTVAASRGILVADTKFEFGWRNEQLILIDEVLTPDSSRFWSADAYTPGRGQSSFDKQPLRDWLDVERHAGRWTGDAPPPSLPEDVIRATSLRYRDAFARLTGAPLDLARLGLPEDRH